MELLTDKVKPLAITGRRQGKVTKVYDGDTVHIVYELCPCFGHVRSTCRLVGYNSAEMKGPDVAKAVAARDALAGLILNKIVDFEAHGSDMYGRLLVDIETNGINITQYMLTNGHGALYNGRGPKNY